MSPGAKVGVAARLTPSQILVKMPTSTVLMPILVEARSMLCVVNEPFTVNLSNSWNPGDVPETRA